MNVKQRSILKIISW